MPVTEKTFKIVSFLMLNIIAPFLLVLIISPSVIDYAFSHIDINRRIWVQILSFSALFIMMLKSSYAAITISVWAIIITVVIVSYELNNILP